MLVDIRDMRGMVFSLGQLRRKAEEGRFLFGALRVAAVHGDGNDAPRSDEIQRLCHRRDGGFGLCRYLFFPSRKIAEVENHCSDFSFDACRYQFLDVQMRTLYQFASRKHAFFFEQGSRFFDCGFLDIEGVYLPAAACHFCQCQSVAAVSGGCVDHDVPFGYVFAQNLQ